MKKHTILIVDDSEINRALLIEMLSESYNILEAANGVEAVTALRQNRTEISLMLLDIMMPEMNGFEVLEYMNQCNYIDLIPVIIITAEASTSSMEQAYSLGAVDYINRPFEKRTVQHRVKNTIVLYTKQRILEDMVMEQLLEKEENNSMMVEILSHIVEFRNGESGLHVLHIRVITEILLRQLMLTDKYPMSAYELNLIVTASALHDIGKISISEDLINKPGKLTPEEFEIIKTHSIVGEQMLADIPYYQDKDLVKIARAICRWHHERYDGNGYPDGLSGDDIPICAQIVSLADVYDALVSKRVYKDAYSSQKSLDMILNGECGAFNPILLECLSSVAPYLECELESCSFHTHSRKNLGKIPREILNIRKQQ